MTHSTTDGPEAIVVSFALARVLASDIVVGFNIKIRLRRGNCKSIQNGLVCMIGPRDNGLGISV
jgi:hypothetical protein